MMGMREGWKIVTGGNEGKIERKAITGRSEERVHKN
jgi:hypothetical protein